MGRVPGCKPAPSPCYLLCAANREDAKADSLRFRSNARAQPQAVNVPVLTAVLLAESTSLLGATVVTT